MYAIVEESGGQRRVAEGDEFLIDLKDGGEAEAGSKITFDRVLVVGDEGGKAKIGQPYVEGAAVTAEVLAGVEKGTKLHVYKFKPKTGYRRKTGHRQRYTRVKVTGITG